MANTLGKSPLSALVLKTRAKVNCQDKSEPAQAKAISPMTIRPVVDPNILAKAMPKGASEVNNSALGTMPAMTLVEAM